MVSRMARRMARGVPNGPNSRGMAAGGIGFHAAGARVSMWASKSSSSAKPVKQNQIILAVPRVGLRCLGQRWLKILWKMWQAGERDDPQLHQRNRPNHGSGVIGLRSTPNA